MFNHEKEHDDRGMIILQANIDDMNPEFCPYVAERLFHQGANDVYWIPIIMKKGRPGMMLNVLTDEALLEKMEQIIFSETTTLGVRYFPVSIHRLGRTFVEVDTSWGKVPVKAGFHGGKLVQYAPEFEVCKQIAESRELPLKQVYDEVRARFRAEYKESGGAVPPDSD